MNSSETGLTQAERAYVRGLLQDSENEFLRLTAGLTESQWSWKAGPGCWSVQQIAEHVVLGEKAMLAKIAEALAGPPDADWEERDTRKTKFLGRVLPDRSRKATAPASLEPRCHWTRAETLDRYQQGRARTLQLIDQADQPMKDRSAKHPFPVFDMLNAYQWLLYIPLHNARHNQQIAEVLAKAVKEAVP
jgi:hypothetical protein